VTGCSVDGRHVCHRWRIWSDIEFLLDEVRRNFLDLSGSSILDLRYTCCRTVAEEIIGDRRGSRWLGLDQNKVFHHIPGPINIVVDHRTVG
jgi:hypothetical protein